MLISQFFYLITIVKKIKKSNVDGIYFSYISNKIILYIFMNNINYTFNILITGNNNVGKTSLIKKYTNKEINNYNKNILNYNNNDTFIWLDNLSIKLNLFDHSNNYDLSNNSYFYGIADVILIICDITDDKTYNIDEIIKNKKLYINNIDNYIINNKIDKINFLYDKREYTTKYHNISVKTNYGINILFKIIVRKLIDNIKKNYIDFNKIEYIIDDNNKNNNKNIFFKMFKFCY